MTTRYTPYELTATATQEDKMRTIFDAIHSEAHWKGPIDAIVKLADAQLAADAVEFFTGTKATVKPITGLNGLAHVEAVGYWAGPCN